jgi:hypothetical protein
MPLPPLEVAKDPYARQSSTGLGSVDQDYAKDPYARQSNIGVSSIGQEAVKNSYARQTIIGMSAAGPINGPNGGPGVGRQPLIKLNGQSVEVSGQPRDVAQNMNFTPIHIKPMGTPANDINSNYAMEATQVGGVKTLFDPKMMDLNMDIDTSNQTPKIYTYTYGNMMNMDGPLVGGPRTIAYWSKAFNIVILLFISFSIFGNLFEVYFLFSINMYVISTKIKWH